MTETIQASGAPTCPCCGGSGGHGYRAFARGGSDRDDDEGCTLCGERGHTWHDGKPDSCQGFRELMRRVNR